MYRIHITIIIIHVDFSVRSKLVFATLHREILDRLADELKDSAMARAAIGGFRPQGVSIYLPAFLHTCAALTSAIVDDVCHTLSNWISSGRMFGDLSIQIHYGQG